MLKMAYGNNIMKKAVLDKWYSKFEQGALLALKYQLTHIESGFFLG